MSGKPQNNKNIGDIVRGALHTGDLTKLADLGPAVESAVRNIQDNASRAIKNAGAQGGAPRPQGQQQSAGQNAAPPPGRPPAPVWQGRSAPGAPRMPGANAGMATMALGVLGVVAFGLCTLIFALLGATVFQSLFWTLSAFFAVATGISGVALAVGASTRGLAKRAAQYYALLQDKKVYTYEDLTAKLGRAPKDIRQDIRKARKKGMLPEVRTDAGETCVMMGEDTYRLYLESEESRRRREAEEEQRRQKLGDSTSQALERFKAEGQDTIRKIRAANDAIPGEEISGKLSRLEATCLRIFDYVEKYPQKLPDTRKFMSYYLPTTLKLVEKYRQYEEMEVQPANIQKAKAEIAGTLDTIDAAFNNLFESLYQDDTLDVSTDIQVLEKMLEQEGLTGKQFTIEARPD